VSAASNDDMAVRTFNDLVRLKLDLIECQRSRVFRAIREDSANNETLNSTLSVELKRLNSMIDGFHELVKSPPLQTVIPAQQSGPGLVTRMLLELQATNQQTRK
jgi:hypothetical protein